jgi:hypothetical protein
MRLVERLRQFRLAALSHRRKARNLSAALALSGVSLIAAVAATGIVQAADDAEIHSFLMSQGGGSAPRAPRARSRLSDSRPRPVVRRVAHRAAPQKNRPARPERIKYASLPRADAPQRVQLPAVPKPKPPAARKGPPDYIAALMKDPTLRRGDIVMLANGPHVFRGAQRAVHTLKDFEALRSSKMASNETRRLFLPRTKAVRLADEPRRMVGKSPPEGASPPAAPVSTAGIRIVYPVSGLPKR